MTEAQAYDYNGWPHEGECMSFILPMTGDDRDYTPWRCNVCRGKGIAETTFFNEVMKCKCSLCNSDLVYPGMKSQAERLRECLDNINKEERPGTKYIEAKRFPELQALLKEGTPFIQVPKA